MAEDPIGIVLAAGAGTRMGHPKALLRTADGRTWAERAAAVLSAAGCRPVILVAGAQSQLVLSAMAGTPFRVVVADDWADGMSASLKCGLATAVEVDPAPSAAVLTPCDVPGLTSAVVQRCLEGAGPDSLVQAIYQFRPGHPVVLGSNHWAGIISSVSGDEGARSYLMKHQARRIDCSDLGDGSDVDVPDDLPPGSVPPPL